MVPHATYCAKFTTCKRTDVITSTYDLKHVTRTHRVPYLVAVAPISCTLCALRVEEKCSKNFSDWFIRFDSSSKFSKFGTYEIYGSFDPLGVSG